MAATDTGTWHRLLLRLGGRLPDGALAAARAALAASGPEHAAAVVAGAVAEHAVPVTPAEAGALGLPPDSGPRQDDAAAPGYRFAPSREPVGRSFDGGPALLLDLTGAHAGLREAAADRVDDDAMAAAARAADPAALVALWRAWRFAGGAPARVYLLEVDLPTAELPGVTAHVQRALAAAGVADPQVEVYAPDEDLPAYHRFARGSSALLWARTRAGAITTARVFDGADPEAGPRFADDHPRIDDAEERRRLLAWLAAGTVLLATTERGRDVLDPDRGAVVPLNYRTDGAWVWTDAVAHYLDVHHLAPDPGLADHIRSRGHALPSVDAVAGHRALAYLLNPEPAPARP
ncbi:hypothetical protein [Spirilliplanes yamanashiensis]|uniref:Uncharacterized protein n=1 Tax=Spirilliplanes yamanashiensis TaxID=42233 RepID=A0A8J3Y829_9ACTN|nr:hypothetical protein [Spirilliplanes yamanashiensis]MDP9817279.1 hypothetical protein [Spirilliplanes yamanashiensis]GIJ03069.1 hypothetical protein Sya03_24210 [Spirilliplanes yamanashiensis]